MYINQLRLAVNERRELLSKKITIAMPGQFEDSIIRALTLSELEQLWSQCQKVRNDQFH